MRCLLRASSLSVATWLLLVTAGLAIMVSGCGGGAVSGSAFPGPTAAETAVAKSKKDHLPSDPQGLGARFDSGEGLLRGGDAGANTMERCCAQGRYVVFHTAEALAGAADANGVHDVYLRDLLTGQVELISTNGAMAGNGQSIYGVISSDGRYVAFASQATDLVAGDNNGFFDVFRRDRTTGTTQMVSVSSAENLGRKGDSIWPAISSDGNIVAFQSAAKNLVPADKSGWPDVFVRNVSAGTTTKITAGNSTSYQPTISGDGRFVAFSSLATNLVAGDTNGVLDIYWYDRTASATERVSVDSNEVQGNLPSYLPSISDDGQKICFDTASALVTDDTNGKRDVYVRDRATGATSRASLASDGVTQGNGDCFHASLDRDGFKVAFSSTSSNLVSGDTNTVRDIFWRTVGQAVLVRASEALDDSGGNGDSDQASWTDDGTRVLYRTASTNLDWTDTDGGVRDIMILNRSSDSSACCSQAVAVSTRRVNVTSAGAQATGGDGVRRGCAISGDGRYVAFCSPATNLVVNDTNGLDDIFVHDRLTGVTTRVSVASNGSQATGGPSTSAVRITPDGRFVIFESLATNLVAGDTNGYADIFVHDRQTATTTRVNLSSGGAQATGAASSNPSISSDGNLVTWHSAAANLVGADTNGLVDVFVRDRTTGVTTRANVSTAGAQATGGDSTNSMVAGDGTYVAFSSYATNLVSGDTNGSADNFVRNLTSGSTTRVSVSTSGAQATANSYTPCITPDGRYIAFRSMADNLVTGDTNGYDDVFVRDRLEGTTSRASVSSAEEQALGSHCGDPTISADGRFVSFWSTASNLVSGDTNGLQDIFVRDRVTGTLARMNLSSGGDQATGGEGWIYSTRSVSSDGRFLLFTSNASNLVGADTNGDYDVFVRDMLVP